MDEKKNTAKDITRRELLKCGVYGGLAAGLSSSLWLSGCSSKKHLAHKQPNIILISLDTLRADHLGCYGYQRPTSPNIDKFASRGVLFEDVMATSPWTLPSHGSILTGLYPNRHGLKSPDSALNEETATLAEILKGKGYYTKAIVNSIFISKRFGLDKGFDDYTYIKELMNQRSPGGVEIEGMKWLTKHHEKPFFLFLHLYDVHSDYCSLPFYEEQFVRPYKGKANGTTSQLVNASKGKVKFSRAGINHLFDLYDASIRQIDDVIGNLLEFLETKGLLDSSLVILTSDHGEEFAEHGGVLHSQTQYQELLSVPLIISGPNIAKAKRTKNVVSLVDIMPTTLSYLGIQSQAPMDGLDLSCLLQADGSPLPSRYVFAEASKATDPKRRKELNNIKYAIRHPRYKLHYNKKTEKSWLYDLQDDPKEKVNVLSEHEQLANLMLEQLKHFMEVDTKGVTLPPLSSEEMNKLKSLGYL